jgi:hypothetical protein
VNGVEYNSYLSVEEQPPSRSEIERTVFTDLLAANNYYQEQSEQLAQGLIDLKERVLNQQPEPDLYAFVQDLLKGLVSGS